MRAGSVLHRLAALGIACGLACATRVGAAAPASPEAAQGWAGLSDEEFWADPWKTRDDVLSRLQRESFQGILLDAPRAVPLGTRDDWPLVGYRGATIAESERDPLEDALLAVVLLETGELFLAPAFPEKRRAPAPTAAPASPSGGKAAKLPSGPTASSFHIDVLARLPELRQRSGTALVTLLVGDARSNRVRSQLASAGPGAPATRPAAATGAAAWPAPGDPFPSYRKDARSPADPAGPGIALGVTAAGAPSRSILRGSLAVRGASGVAPVHLVLAEGAAAAAIRIQVPVSGDATAGSLRRGYFGLDPLSLPGAPDPGRRYRVWAFQGESMAGAVAIGPEPK